MKERAGLTKRAFVIFLALIGALSCFPIYASESKPTNSSLFRDSDEYSIGYYSGDVIPDKTIYLTFDDGPSPFTLRLLILLKSLQVKASFFITANGWGEGPSRFQDYEKVLKRMVADKHSIGNHSYSHKEYSYLEPEKIKEDMDKLDECFLAAVGPIVELPEWRADPDGTCHLRLARPPFGLPWVIKNPKLGLMSKVTSFLRTRAFVISWSSAWEISDAEEWVKGETASPFSEGYDPKSPSYKKKVDGIVKAMLDSADNTRGRGAIILLHDTHPTTVDAIPRVVEGLKERGYSFSTLNEYAHWRWGEDCYGQLK